MPNTPSPEVPGRPGRRLSRTVLALLALAWLAPPPARSYDFSAVIELLEENLASYSGGVFVQVHQHDAEIFTFQGGGEVGPGSHLRMGSASKWLSSAIVLRLAERGLLRLDDRIGDYLPIFDLHGKGDVTIRQCFAMNSGLYETEVDYETAPLLTLAEAADLIAVFTPIVFPPGTQLAYEGDGMEVVGRIAEVVTGKDWRTLADEELAQPLGLADLEFDLFPVNPGVPGGARTSPADYQRFLRMVLREGLADDGSRYLGRASVREWFTNQTAGLPEYDSPWPPYPYPYGARPDYGHGAWVLAQDPETGRVEEVTSPGVFGTFPWVDARRGLTGVIAMDAAGGFAATRLTDLRVLDALRAAIDAAIFADGFESGDLSRWSDATH